MQKILGPIQTIVWLASVRRWPRTRRESDRHHRELVSGATPDDVEAEGIRHTLQLHGPDLPEPQ